MSISLIAAIALGLLMILAGHGRVLLRKRWGLRLYLFGSGFVVGSTLVSACLYGVLR